MHRDWLDLRNARVGLSFLHPAACGDEQADRRDGR